jgi:hypothetical protein
MSISELVMEGLVEDVEWEGPSQEDWDWYFEQTWVDPEERVE